MEIKTSNLRKKMLHDGNEAIWLHDFEITVYDDRPIKINAMFILIYINTARGDSFSKIRDCYSWVHL